MTDKKWIVVTGGAGFLGSHLCERLIREDKRVYCLDNLSSGALTNLNSLLHHPNFVFKHHDVIEPFSIRSVQSIYNLASPASPQQYQKNPIQTWQTNVYGAYNALTLASTSQATILQASTSEIYGDPLEHPQQETYYGHVNPIGIRSCYNESKRAAESIFFDFHRHYLLKIKIARLFNVYGPRMLIDDGRVIPNFILKALQHQPLTIYGDGNQTRSFCYVDDLIEGMVSLMQSASALTGPYNLGNAHEISIIDLANLIIQLTQSKSKIIYKTHLQDDPKRRLPNLMKAEVELGFSPQKSLQEGLVETIHYFERLLVAKVI